MAESTSMTATTEGDKQMTPSIFELYKHGDVILKLRNDTTAYDLLVSSHALSLVSPVFSAMFNDAFVESQNLSSASTRQIDLPDDDPELMKALCDIAYMRTADIPSRHKEDFLVEFAVLCDKYDCTQAVRPWSGIWFSSLFTACSLPVVMDTVLSLLFFSYVMDLPDEFQKSTQKLCRTLTGPINFEKVTFGYDFLPLKVIGK